MLTGVRGLDFIPTQNPHGTKIRMRPYNWTVHCNGPFGCLASVYPVKFSQDKSPNRINSSVFGIRNKASLITWILGFRLGLFKKKVWDWAFSK